MYLQKMTELLPCSIVIPETGESLPKTAVSFYCDRTGSCHKRQEPQAPTPQAPIRNRQTKKSQTPKV